MSEAEEPIPIAGRRQKAGHRTWAARSAAVPGSHAGDIMSQVTRSSVMSRIRGKNTGPAQYVVSFVSVAFTF